MKSNEMLESLFKKPYWVIDFLPAQVPAERGGQFFQVEELLLRESRKEMLRRRFADVLLKLNCYYDLVVYRGEAGKGRRNPNPEKLEKWVMKDGVSLNVVLPSENALLVVPTDSTCMTLYGPTEDLLQLVRSLALASGLFVWKPEHQEA